MGAGFFEGFHVVVSGGACAELYGGAARLGEEDAAADHFGVVLGGAGAFEFTDVVVGARAGAEFYAGDVALCGAGEDGLADRLGIVRLWGGEEEGGRFYNSVGVRKKVANAGLLGVAEASVLARFFPSPIPHTHPTHTTPHLGTRLLKGANVIVSGRSGSEFDVAKTPLSRGDARKRCVDGPGRLGGCGTADK